MEVIMKNTTYNNIVKSSGKTFQKFISQLTSQLSRPKAKFIRQLLCGVVFSGNLILTNIASRLPQTSKLTAIAKRFRRQLADNRPFLKPTQKWVIASGLFLTK